MEFDKIGITHPWIFINSRMFLVCYIAVKLPKKGSYGFLLIYGGKR
jgi:hypothetical protein